MGVVEPRLGTVVVGAGPAGLLFCITGRLLHARQGGRPADWPLWLVDKRTAYVRTHRLRMDPRPYRAIRDAVADPRFDALIGWLDEERFRPTINDLEERLSALAAELAVERHQLAVGDPDGLSLPALRAWVEADHAWGPEDRLTVVGADSVHSAVRAMALGPGGGRTTHAEVARLKLEGPGLPERLGWLGQVRLSKLLGSLLDYRLNRNGYAEVDLFLAPAEHRAVTRLGARPQAPVVLDDQLDRLRAPLFTKVARHLAQGFGAGPLTLSLTSTFRLEVQHAPRVAVAAPELGGFVFLVGDAAVSLPFFRGMACLGACVHRLAEVHVELLAGAGIDPVARYEEAVADIRTAEQRVVAARSWGIQLARDFARVSALLPFPIQSWFLSVGDPDPTTGRVSAGLAAGAIVAASAGSIALAAPLLDAHVWAPLGWLWLLALPLQVGGGALYDAARIFEGPNRYLAWVWRLQVLVLMVVGPAVTVLNSWTLGRAAQVHSLASWFVLGLAFALGLVAFEAVHDRLIAGADAHDPH